MIKALGWLFLAYIITVVGKIIAKKLFPEDWE